LILAVRLVRPFSTTTCMICMGFSTRHLISWLALSLLSWATLSAETVNDAGNPHPALARIQKAETLRYSHPDSSLKMMAESMDNLLATGDTLTVVQALRTSANIYGNLANYKDAYDDLWKALLLSDEAGLDREKALVYIDIGRHYSFYKRRDKALEYFHISLDINKALLKEGKISHGKLVESYYAFCSTYRELDEFDLARTYLDSCMQVFEEGGSEIDMTYLQFELACILNAEKKYPEAIQIFEKVESWFEENEPSYLVLFYTYLGDAQMELGQFELSERNYKKGLDISAAYNMHIDFSPLIHEKLSALYLKQGDYRLAYERLETAKALDEAFFDSRSANNRSLLEIQDAFRREREAQQEIIRQQKLEQLEREEDVWFLERVILMVSLLFIVSLGFLFFKYMRSRYMAEKQLLQKQKELELKKANEVLEIKNKELAASALKLIEKDESLAMLKGKIKEASGAVDVNELKKVVRSISVSNHRNWEEFEARFVSINQSFYSQLQEKFPQLSQRDLKLCALIKLNFSSKEMAKLLGISVESAHTSRYRLRKKLNLKREVNLTEFIASI